MLDSLAINNGNFCIIPDTQANAWDAAHLPVADLWPESYIAVNEVASTLPFIPVSFINEIANFVIVLSIISLFIITFMRIAEGLFSAAVSAFNLKALINIEQQIHIQTSRNITLIFSILLAAFIFANYNSSHPVLENHFPTGINFILAIVAVAGYFIFRKLVSILLNWVNRCSFFTLLNRFYYTYSILFACLAIIGFISYIIFPQITFRHIAHYTLSVIILTNLLYYIRSYQLIISNGFSQSFLILYLCTLEFLPQLIIAYIILS